MLTLLWIVAVLVVALVLAYVNASGAAFTAAFAVALGVAWFAHTLPGWAALAADDRVRAARDSGERAGAAAQARERRRARRVPQADAADVANGARRDRGRHRLVGRRALLGAAGLAAPARDADPVAHRGRAAFPRPRRRGALRDGDRLGDDARLPRPAAARVAIHQGPRLSRDEHREGVRRSGLLGLCALAGDDQAVDPLGHGVGDRDGAELARTRRAPRALRHGRAEAPLPAAAREGPEIPCFALDGPDRRLGRGVDPGLRHRLLGRARRPARARARASPGTSATSRSARSRRCSASRSAPSTPITSSASARISASPARSFRRRIRAW